MKRRAIALLLISQIAAMSLWFVSAAIMPDMLNEGNISAFRQAALSSGVQIGFVFGALVSAVMGLADRFDPRRVFAICALLAGIANATMLLSIPGSTVTIAARFMTGALLAGVYPVGMKIAVSWGEKDRGLLVGLLVGALTLGSALPFLISFSGGADWRQTVLVTSIAAVLSGILCLFVGLGPHHQKASKFDPSVIKLAWSNKRIRYAYGGYLGHMWELYVMWAWIAAACTISFAAHMNEQDASTLAALTAFIAIASGAMFCIIAGHYADRIGKSRVASMTLFISGLAGIATALTFGGPPWLTILLVILWGASVIPDSAQFSALVADAAPKDATGSLMTLQTAIGFALTFITVQAAPLIAAQWGWPIVLVLTALGPAFGMFCMKRLQLLENEAIDQMKKRT